MSETAIERERLVRFEAAANFRDLGGYPSRVGGSTVWGRVYRAAAIHDMTAADLERFHGLGIETVYDLRSAVEFQDRPDPVTSVNVPLLGRFIAARERPDFSELVEHDHGVDFMRQMTVDMLHWGGPEIGCVIGGLAEADRLPAVFHCTAGKDRTGIVAALLLEVLGVDREHVLDDFHLTERYREGEQESVAFQQMLAHGMPPEAAVGALGAPRETMRDALGELDATYGGVERYLIDQGGLDAAIIGALRANLIG